MPAPNYLHFDGYQSRIDLGSGPGLDNLPQGANGFTVELWVNILAWAEFYDDTTFLSKVAIGTGNWNFRHIIDNDYSLVAHIQDTTPENCNVRCYKSDFNWFYEFEKWHHLAMTFNFYGDKDIHIWINGVEPDTYYQQVTMAGTPTSDAAAEAYIGNWYNDRGPYAYFGWSRISNIVRYTEDFTPPSMCTLPAIDVNTVGQWIGVEKNGVITAVDNQEGTATRDGVATEIEWGKICVVEGTHLHDVTLGAV